MSLWSLHSGSHTLSFSKHTLSLHSGPGLRWVPGGRGQQARCSLCPWGWVSTLGDLTTTEEGDGEKQCKGKRLHVIKYSIRCFSVLGEPRPPNARSERTEGRVGATQDQGPALGGWGGGGRGRRPGVRALQSLGRGLTDAVCILPSGLPGTARCRAWANQSLCASVSLSARASVRIL